MRVGRPANRSNFSIWPLDFHPQRRMYLSSDADEKVGQACRHRFLSRHHLSQQGLARELQFAGAQAVGLSRSGVETRAEHEMQKGREVGEVHDGVER